MSTVTLALPERGILRHSSWDALLVALALLHALAARTFPFFPVIALGLWWNSNTIAHYFIHKPFFRARLLNFIFSLYLSLLLGVPQTYWRGKHLAHHVGSPWRGRFTTRLAGECALILAFWAILIGVDAWFFLTAYMPGYLVGLLLCYLHGHYEHVRGSISHYVRVYNLLFLNDGYHAEHHARPNEHWTKLPNRKETGGCPSRWPAILRWLEIFSLDNLERCLLQSHWLQNLVIRCHERAFRALFPVLPTFRKAAVIGGGIFPRTVLILRRLFPGVELIVIDKNAANLAQARAWLPTNITLIPESYSPELVCDCDLAVFPLAFVGDRQAIYDQPPCRVVAVHDWLWRPHGRGAIVSWFLFKRVNLVAG